jgi:hypothetical protein
MDIFLGHENLSHRIILKKYLETTHNINALQASL